jgi:hypothetical protein
MRPGLGPGEPEASSGESLQGVGGVKQGSKENIQRVLLRLGTLKHFQRGEAVRP